MAQYTKISNGETLTECELYDYLNTAKGYCCEKGWIWRNDDTEVEHTGREWKAIWAADPPWECVPVFEYTAEYETLLDVVGFYIGNDAGVGLNVIVDWGDGNIIAYDGSSGYDITYSYAIVSTYNIKVYVRQYEYVENLDFSSVGTNDMTAIVFYRKMSHMNDGVFIANSNQLPSNYINDILAYLVSIPCTSATIDISSQTPPAPPTGQGIIDKATLISNGCTVTTD